MGIRMLSRRTAPAQAPPPAHAVGASTARVPGGPAAVLSHAAADLRRRVTAHWNSRRPLAPRARDTAAWRLWADLARGYLALCLTLLPRAARPASTLTVFVAPLPVVAGAIRPPDGSGPAPCRPLPNR
ncbi:hypothetical protein [Streptomyces chromofuscus]|uniref:hypothetical protein n=1 Tax=Streptomyces chromofuscus TaxID=42881 RepID=UPI0019CAF07E|nr:hypothetical protein [Streptomyces chromofuscus]GGT12750.1 hypothetical protein GCM10010254_36790 [Streptomyces chromofuscus]